MTIKTQRYRTLGTVSALAVAASLLAAGGAMAQSSTATLRGTVYDSGQIETGGTVTATEVSTGYVNRGRVSADGGYVIPGLRPGTFRVTVTTADGQSTTDTVTIGLGQVTTLNLDVSAASAAPADGAAAVDDIVVTGRRLLEVRTSEVATNVTQQQINDLPQISRNFLNFAALAPGVQVQEGDTERTISAGGQPSLTVNVFIDGQSQKSLITDGGIAGQDDSRGNPFPQAAVQEFRVLTQNFKAEYEQASSAIITSVTRSGTNTFTGDAFVFWQNGDWTAQNEFARRRGESKARLDRLQYGGSVGGPIIEDTLHYFLSYERKEETRERSVFLNQTAYNGLFTNELGTFEAPFEEDLAFGKLSWQIDDRQRIDLSATYREEQDVRDFGNGPTSRDRATAVNGSTRSIVLRHQYQGDGFLNEFSIDYFNSVYNPRALNFDQSAGRYVVFRDNVAGGAFNFAYNQIEATIFNFGGGANNQDLDQEAWTIKNDLTFTDLQWMGSHTLKMGVKYSRQTLGVSKEFNRNPFFTYDVQARPEIFGSTTIPTQVSVNLPVDPTEAENNVWGLYIQDDWQITDKLELNIGLRWDYEDNAVNNDYSTPQVVRDLIAAFQTNAAFQPPVNPANYITNGRDAYTNAWQPRIGFSYDVFGDERTVIFGGAGRYFDRIGFNFAFDERFKPYQRNRTIYFSPAGGTFGGRTDTVAWNPIYATAAGLDALLAGTTANGEVFLIDNSAPPPRTDQFNFGIRQKFWDIQTALTFSYAKTENEFQWSRLNVNNLNQLTVRPSQFIDPSTSRPFAFNDSVFYSDHSREREYKAMYLTIDRPYNDIDGWGFNVAYTLADSTQNGSRGQGLGNFDFDYATVAISPTFNSPDVDRHRLVASGTMRIPGDWKLSSILTLASGKPYNINSCPDAQLPGPAICWNAAYPDKKSFIIPNAFAFRQIDLRLAKTLELWDGNAVEFTIDGINIFNFQNYSSFETNFTNARYGQPTNQYLPTRSIQLGLRYRW
ncbi:MAG TPA: TonB-dependent receptor [Brevundimonas sp.]|uniref:TonB-dependent receptor n=1 Tax=Brevundimonas sp. TaxID=1871086 RepID=UPI0026371388|nr:TonB-dependent receptor [Brevundimonas sp.]HRO32898.1 TonB-dependent receptor [Brevundimonas sp.]